MSALDFDAMLSEAKRGIRRKKSRKKSRKKPVHEHNGEGEEGRILRRLQLSKVKPFNVPGIRSDSAPSGTGETPIPVSSNQTSKEKKGGKGKAKGEGGGLDLGENRLDSSGKGLDLGEIKRKIEWKDYCVSETGVWYIPEFITSKAEKLLISRAYDNPKWVKLRNRRLQSVGADITQNGSISETHLPLWLSQLSEILEVSGAFSVPVNSDKGVRANHVLINEYKSGQGIMAHKDGPSYYPCVCIISLNSSILFHFYQTLHDAKSINPSLQVLLEPGSLLVFSKDAYRNLFHGIPERNVDIILNPKLTLANYHHLSKCRKDKPNPVTTPTDTCASISYGTCTPDRRKVDNVTCARTCTSSERNVDEIVVERKTRVSLTIRKVYERSAGS